MMRFAPRFATGLLAVTACSSTTFSGVTPISPKVGGTPQSSWTTVDTLQPLLRWTPASEPDASYDVIIYEGVKATSFMRGTERTVGTRAYYREGLKATEHRVEERLRPHMEYYWSVRIRRDGQVSDWSRYDYRKGNFVIGGQWGNNLLFRFKTPPR